MNVIVILYHAFADEEVVQNDMIVGIAVPLTLVITAILVIMVVVVVVIIKLRRKRESKFNLW